MSIVLAGISTTRGLLAVDTLGVMSSAPETSRPVNKLITMPSLGMAVAASGDSNLLACLLVAFQAAADFDAVADALLDEKAVEQLARGYVDALVAAGNDAAGEFHVEQDHMIVVMGYSASLGRIRGVATTKNVGQPRWSSFEFGSLVSPPVDDAVGELKVDEMRRVASRQVGEYIASGPIGGRLIVAEVTREGITTTAHQIAPLAEPDSE